MAVTDYNPVVLKLLQRNVEENDEAVGGACNFLYRSAASCIAWLIPQYCWRVSYSDSALSSRARSQSCVALAVGRGNVSAPGGSVTQTSKPDVRYRTPWALTTTITTSPRRLAGRARCRELLWGNADHEAALLEESPGGGGYDLLLGADIIYPGSQARAAAQPSRWYISPPAVRCRLASSRAWRVRRRVPARERSSCRNCSEGARASACCAAPCRLKERARSPTAFGAARRCAPHRRRTCQGSCIRSECSSRGGRGRSCSSATSAGCARRWSSCGIDDAPAGPRTELWGFESVLGRPCYSVTALAAGGG